MLSYIKYNIHELQKLMISEDSKYRIDLEYKLYDWIDSKRLICMYDYNVYHCIERLSRSNSGIITTRLYDVYQTSIVANRVKKVYDRMYDLNIILRVYDNISDSFNYIVYKEYQCCIYRYRINNIEMEIIIINSTMRLCIRLYGNINMECLEHILLDISKTLYNSTCIISSNVYRVIKDYVHDNTFTMPKTIYKQQIYRMIGPYLISKKLDGERRLICITMYGIYSIDRSSKIYHVSDVLCSYRQQSIIDCEYYNNIYYIIDTLMFKGRNIKHMHILERLNAASKLHDILPYNVVNKKYSVCNRYTLNKVINKVLNSNIYDGIILTRSDSNYNRQPIKIKKNNTCDLLYDGNSMISSDGKKFGTVDDVLEVGRVYECVKVGNNWKPIRIRYDKIVANNNRTINSCNSSCTIYDMLRCCDRSISIFTNEIKSVILDTHIKGSILLDIGSGYGTDIYKWNKYKHVYIIEPDESKIQVLLHRIQEYKINSYTIICYKLSMLDNIINEITTSIDCITCFFCYMNLTDEDIDCMFKLIKIVSSDNCTVDIITTDKELVRLHNDNKYITIKDDNIVHVKIPNTLIDNDERLVDTAYIESRMHDIGYNTFIISNIKPMFAISGYQARIISTFKYLGFNIGNVRNICRSEQQRKRIIYTVEGDIKSIHIDVCNYNLISYNKQYLIEDHNLISLF